MIIAMVSSKGGVGKSAAALGLAAGLAYNGHPTLLIDLDGMNRTVTNYFEPPLGAMADAMAGAVLADTVTEVRDNLFFLGADERLDSEDAGLWAGVERLTDQIDEGLRFVIIDCPAQFKAASRSAVGIADEVIIPVNSAQEALESAISTQRRIREMRPELPVRFLLTMNGGTAEAQVVRRYKADWSKASILQSSSARYLALSSLTPYDPGASRAWRLRHDYDVLVRETIRREKRHSAG